MLAGRRWGLLVVAGSRWQSLVLTRSRWWSLVVAGDDARKAEPAPAPVATEAKVENQ